MSASAHRATARVGDVFLVPGDVLFYRTNGVLAWWARLTTRADVDHAEVYVGHGRAFAARRAGIDVYPLRLDGVCYVLRPVRPYDASRAMAARRWVCKGPSRGVFSAAVVARDARAGGVISTSYVDLDRVTVRHLLRLPDYTVLWRAT